MSNERLNEAPRFTILVADAEPVVGPGFRGARYWRAFFQRSGFPWKNRFGAPRLDPPRKRLKK